MQGGIVINKNDLMNTIQSLEEKGIEGIGAYELSRILKSSRKEIGEKWNREKHAGSQNL